MRLTGERHAPGFSRVGIVGGGIMGVGIAEVCARAGCETVVAVPTAQSVQRARARLDRSLGRAVDKQELTPGARDACVSRVRFTTRLEALRDSQLIVEAAPENEETKAELFRSLDRLVEAEDAALASTTSSLSIGRLADATARPQRVLGTHFFSPVPAAPLVELVAAPDTDAALLTRVETFLAQDLGKEVVRCADRCCFLVNALLVPYLMEAVRLVEAGVATPADIDRGMVLGCGHPMGPLKLADLIGLDTVASAARSLHEATGEPRHAPPELLLRMVRDGTIGKKSGQGFHRYR